MMTNKNQESRPDLISPHGGYRNLKSYQTAEIVYDATTAFCNRFVDKRSRTHGRWFRQSVVANRILPRAVWYQALQRRAN